MSVTPSLNSLGPSSPIALKGNLPGALPPSVICALSAGSALTFNVEVTAASLDPVTGQLPNDNWAPLPSASGLTASTAVPVPVKATAVRVNVTAYTSGQLSVAVAQ